MSDSPITEAQIKEFAAAWYQALDQHVPPAAIAVLLADEGLEMIFPEKTLHGMGDFLAWYAGGDYSDGTMFSIPGGRYKPNAWGLCDTHGNVAEWTRTEYRVYPYAEEDGRNAVRPEADGRKSPGGIVVRGGSWNDTFRSCRSASRWHYLPCQPVYNVGFRVVCKPVKSGAKAQLTSSAATSR